MTDPRTRAEAVFGKTALVGNLGTRPDVGEGWTDTDLVAEQRFRQHRGFFRSGVAGTLADPSARGGAVANTAEAMGGGGTIPVEVTPHCNHVRVSAEDGEPDIPADLKGRVVDPFITTKPPGGGTGLGSHLVHRVIAERHGGTIEASSKPGRPRCEVSLPAERAPDG